jgi:hypothetical protein
MAKKTFQFFFVSYLKLKNSKKSKKYFLQIFSIYFIFIILKKIELILMLKNICININPNPFLKNEL